MYLKKKKKSISLKVCVLILARCPKVAMPRAVDEVNMSGHPATCCCLIGGEPRDQIHARTWALNYSSQHNDEFFQYVQVSSFQGLCQVLVLMPASMRLQLVAPPWSHSWPHLPLTQTQ